MHRVAAFIFCLHLLAVPASAQVLATLTGRLTDPSGAVVVGARVRLAERTGRLERAASTDADGVFRFEGLSAGAYTLRVAGAAFIPVERAVELTAGQSARLDVALEVAGLAEEVVVSAPRIAATPDTIPGSLSTLDASVLEASRVFTTSEALRKVSGVNVRDEEGFGLRPNVGIRGVNPTRSTKVLLLEDGIPLTYAPYGDNSSYYHPPIERFEGVEILKGAGQILYGPVTVSGVVNYITPLPPPTPSGAVTLYGGNRDYFNGSLRWGGTWGGAGLLIDAMRKQGEGARENQRFGVNDLNLKLVMSPGSRQSLTLRGNYYGEDSNVGYSGLRQDEYEQNPRQNPFSNDFFYGDRHGASATHSIVLNENSILTTNVYGAIFQRHWWRQSSNSNERPNDSGDPACGGMANLHTTCGNQGRLRRYTTWGVEPHLRARHQLLGVQSDADIGFRVHFEHQDRRQENGERPTSRTGTIVESNVRKNQAYAGFLQNRFSFGKLTVTPGVRVERILYERRNNLANGGAGVTGETDLTQVVPGIGAAYTLLNDITVFGGVHRGFAPPRTEDVIDNATGGSIDLDAELSWNYEAGVRGRVHPSASLEAAFFVMDYENQVVPASLAGGVGATLTNGGQTLHRGLELAGRFDLGTALRTGHNVYVRTAYTYLPTARFEGTRFSSVTGFGTTSVSGNRLPYAPEHLMTTTIGYMHPRGFDIQLESVHVSDQFGDDLNTVQPSPDGQRGLIPAYTAWNAAVNYRVESLRSTFFVTVKNLSDRTYIVDRARGILPSSPRLVQAGLTVEF